MTGPPVYRPNIGDKLKALNARARTRKIPMKSWLFNNFGKTLILSVLSFGAGFALCFFLRL